MCQASYRIIHLKKIRLENELQLEGSGEKEGGNDMKEE